MEWGKQMEKHQENAKLSLYQNTNYSFERRERKTLILDVIDNDASMGTTPLTTAANEFNIKLHEPLIIDKLSDIYLDSFVTFDSATNAVDRNAIAFILTINEFNINSNSNVSNNFNNLIIPNETTTDNTAQIHKGKKMNFVCSINPTKLHNITGNITLLNKGAAFSESGKARFIAEFVIVARDKE
tara:strand:- start:10277 stop:10831 length:555 start_codon:yes stop_codon:yes gene_type:complete